MAVSRELSMYDIRAYIGAVADIANFEGTVIILSYKDADIIINSNLHPSPGMYRLDSMQRMIDPAYKVKKSGTEVQLVTVTVSIHHHQVRFNLSDRRLARIFE